MDFVSLALFGAAVVGLGAAATAIIARWLPLQAIEAAQHGRFVGLGEAPRLRPAYRAQFGPQVGKEAMNVVRTH
ncbi:hypothetical protein [Paraburkholderia acidisoli]|uniref:Uncharacterized protein n=1 Tax=Paraburkholderia acidisoli TaxID=2571748 RepID=A0A7Z2GLB7_9BURK|nr:hypothetical protein [Paraburkholderia acidisoli]QGZ63912.1 hypothetical protein FAZ98_19390 [Paraburkholderia acidisoli]